MVYCHQGNGDKGLWWNIWQPCEWCVSCLSYLINVILVKGNKTKVSKLIPYCSLLVCSMSMSEDPVRGWILSEGKASKITRMSPVGGGCINLASRYDTDAGSFFVKTNRYNINICILFVVVFFCGWVGQSFVHFGCVALFPSFFAWKLHSLCLLYYIIYDNWQVTCPLIVLKLYCIRSIGPSMFEAEALGLGAMYETGTIRVPKPYKVRIFNSSVVKGILFGSLPDGTWCNLLLGIVGWTATYWWFFHHYGIHRIWSI